MYDDWQPMSATNRYGNGNGNNSGNGNNIGNRVDERKPFTPRRNQQNNSNNNRSQSSYHNQTGNANTANNPANPQAGVGQGPNVDMILREEAYNVVGCAINILNELGPGLEASCYEKAIRTEFQLKDIPLLENQVAPIIYKEVVVGEFNIKTIAYETIIVSIIVADTITDSDIAKMVSQLKVAHYQAGLIFNFKYPKLQWQRVML